ncbi:MAG: hypothetical protein JWQ42_3897 [Edaphobacter sp.]|nr:hypothetical protein [Edaphobacter sp.]
MLATGVAMSVGVEQANALQAPALSGDGKNESFAKSFGELTAGTVGMMATMAGGQAQTGDLKGKTEIVPKKVNEAVRSTEMLVQAPATKASLVSKEEKANEGAVGAKNVEAPVIVPAEIEEGIGKSTALAKNVDASVIASAGTQTVSAKTPAKTEGDLPDAAVDVEEPLSDRPSGDVKGVPNLPSGAAGETKEAGPELDGVKAALVRHSDASKPTQPFLVRDEGEPGKPKQTTGGGRAQATPSKKETKDKGNAMVPEGEAKIAGVTVDIAGMQVVTVTPPNGVPAVMAKPDAMGELSESGVGSVAPTTSAPTTPRMSAGGMPAVANGPGSKDHARAGKVVVSGKGGEVTGVTPKPGADAAETRVAATTAKDHSEMKSQGVDGVTAAPAMHGVTSMPGHIAGDNVAARSHANTAGSIVSAVRDGSVAGDRAPIADGPRTLAASPTTLEVGIANGTHGWLKIRAEMTGGGTVNASLSAATSAGQEMLHRELPSLTAYLQEQRVGVNAIALHTTTTDTGSQEFRGGMDGSTARGQAQQNDSQRGDGRQEVAVGSGRTDEAVSYEGFGGIHVGGWLAPAIYAGGTGGGGWLSVRA